MRERAAGRRYRHRHRRRPLPSPQHSSSFFTSVSGSCPNRASPYSAHVYFQLLCCPRDAPSLLILGDCSDPHSTSSPTSAMAVCVESSVSILNSLLPSKAVKLHNAFAELECHLDVLASCIFHWKEVEKYLSDVEKECQRRFAEVAEKEKAFDAKVERIQAILEKREEAVAAKEQLSSVGVESPKASSALAAVPDEKHERSDEIKLSNPGQSIEEVASASFDVAVDDVLAQIEKETVSFPNGCVIPAPEEHPAAAKPFDSLTADGVGPTKDDGTGAPRNSDLKLRQYLREFCEKMDGEGLRKYMVDRRKDVNGLRNELPPALNCAREPAALVLASVEGYYFLEVGVNNGEIKDSRVSANRRACILLLECLSQVLADPVRGTESPVLSMEIRQQAKRIADQWHSKMNLRGETPASNSLDAQAFLQLLGTFGIACFYNEDDLCKLVTAVARRRQTPDLCRSLGLTAKMPGIVDELASDGKHVEAISLSHAFGIMDRIRPGPLLKSYLKEAKKSAQSILKNGSNSPTAQNESTMKELSALKNVLKCIEEFDLESQFPSSPLQKRVVQLERNKSDRKRVAVAVKSQVKRPRANIGTALAHVASIPTERTFYRPLERPQYGPPGLGSYGVALSSNFDRSCQGSYGPPYTTGARSPVALPASYLYTADGLPSSVYGSAAYARSPANYGSYQFGSGLAPPASGYPAPFLR